METKRNAKTDTSNEGIQQTRNILQVELPSGEPFVLVHIRSSPQKCRKLIFTKSSDPRLDSFTSHSFLLIHRELACVALEVLTYESLDAFTIFISKADTSGHYYGPGKMNTMSIIQGMLRSIARNYSPANKRTRVCLFAKSESQYLFLGSKENPRKHILTDAQLLKWWTKCLDGLHDEFDSIAKDKCTLAIPGITNARGIASYFPPSPKLPWSAGDIFWETERREADDTAWAVKRIPRFPDDPKSRFLDSIVADNRAKKVNRKQFWLEMESRQEFLLGKSVGIIGIEGRLSNQLHLPCSRMATSSKRDCERFKSLLLDLDFQSLESTKSATEKLLEMIPDHSKIEFQGTQINAHSGSKRGAASTININNLGTLLVRKKQKT